MKVKSIVIMLFSKIIIKVIVYLCATFQPALKTKRAIVFTIALWCE